MIIKRKNGKPKVDNFSNAIWHDRARLGTVVPHASQRDFTFSGFWHGRVRTGTTVQGFRMVIFGFSSS
ncbi:hypothetical protein A2U01_0051930 [Trifolium medium]|uniref:Uncharacterized protein n=1 Tax=Trifolium medium TaxID=97028 RepID=A0A392R3B2_9FABA|nr:hypothetical protein [Trifolium medium]